MTRQELIHIISNIKSLIDIDSFFERWEDVEIWKNELAKAEELLKITKI